MRAVLFKTNPPREGKNAPRVLLRETTGLPECVRIYATGVVGDGRVEMAEGGGD